MKFVIVDKENTILDKLLEAKHKQIETYLNRNEEPANDSTDQSESDQKSRIMQLRDSGFRVQQKIIIWCHKRACYKKNESFPFVPPPSSICSPQLQSTCHYMVNHHVKLRHVHLGGANNMHPLSWGGGHKRKRSKKTLESVWGQILRP